MPKMGKLVKRSGNNAQWMAHAIEVVMPNASQFIFKFITNKGINYATKLQNEFWGLNASSCNSIVAHSMANGFFNDYSLYIAVLIFLNSL